MRLRFGIVLAFDLYDDRLVIRHSLYSFEHCHSCNHANNVILSKAKNLCTFPMSPKSTDPSLRSG
jgi:hypothetical protein